MSYLTTKCGEPVRLSRTNFKLACCDCGLVHQHELQVNKRGVFLISHRDNRATAQLRRHWKLKAEKVNDSKR